MYDVNFPEEHEFIQNDIESRRNGLPVSGKIFAQEALETIYDFDEKTKFGKMLKNNFVKLLKNLEELKNAGETEEQKISNVEICDDTLTDSG